jgi:hypothetical protein
MPNEKFEMKERNLLRALFTAIVIAFMLPSQAQNISHPEKIKSVTEFSVETKNGKELETKRTLQVYDQSGNITEEIEYDDFGKIKDHTLSEYNGENLKVKESHLLPNGKIESITTYTYDQFGNRLSKTVTTEDGDVKSKKVFRYEYR